MTLSPHVFDASAENFNRLVLENSHKGPVLVHVCSPADNFADAMEALLHIARTDRSYRHDIGRISLLALFDLLGSAHPLTRQYRQALSESLH